MGNSKSGFTLIEMLIGIGILAIISAIVIIAINPGQQFAQARDTQRQNDVKAILDAVQENLISNKGIFKCPGQSLPAHNTPISSAGLDICDCLVPLYIAALPINPSLGNSYITDCNADYNSVYVIRQDAISSRITVSSTGELIDDISITR